ncbi:stage V sporulation protein K [Fictibacillus nanhaiensis]|uniref:stage V sporulation protein K n=1 Tax=Fictibacillus nanhaiensis TaxID=742169 RepID=UPI00203C2291|nr:stage V sporulation protein K [Fictibacillus nanhaiensis]MCM3732077.1 stage V sporulation protein K [Fictibacillus nanhaiensis]
MNEPIAIKKQRQINIVLNQGNEKLKTDDAIILASKDKAKEQHLPLLKIEQELNRLVGMEDLKYHVKEIYAWLHINKCRMEMGMKAEKQALHMLFKGNPGTGKTTVARKLGTLFHEMKVLSKGHLIEAERADLVGEYIGHTAQKTRDLLKKASGGILFIDEAYSLGRGGEKDFGKEAIDTLVKAMEDQQHDFILILAGYPKEMDRFLKLNPGLPSRFPVVISFPDYTADELMEIAKRMLTEREYILTRDCEWKLKSHIERIRNSENESFSNGRYIRNMIEKAVRRQSVRLLNDSRQDRKTLMTIQSDDLVLEERDPI